MQERSQIRSAIVKIWSFGKMEESKFKETKILEYRVFLPKIADAVRDALVFVESRLPTELIEFSILDFSSEFRIVPLHLDARTWLCGKVRGWHLVYNCTAQGSRNAPLSWYAMIASLNRLTQGLLEPVRKARLRAYVDDPALSVCGEQNKETE